MINFYKFNTLIKQIKSTLKFIKNLLIYIKSLNFRLIVFLKLKSLKISINYFIILF